MSTLNHFKWFTFLAVWTTAVVALKKRKGAKKKEENITFIFSPSPL
jgi:hypothetical protein